jgi:hypothetical protein
MSFLAMTKVHKLYVRVGSVNTDREEKDLCSCPNSSPYSLLFRAVRQSVYQPSCTGNEAKNKTRARKYVLFL